MELLVIVIQNPIFTEEPVQMLNTKDNSQNKLKVLTSWEPIESATVEDAKQLYIYTTMHATLIFWLVDYASNSIFF